MLALSRLDFLKKCNLKKINISILQIYAHACTCPHCTIESTHIIIYSIILCSCITKILHVSLWHAPPGAIAYGKTTIMVCSEAPTNETCIKIM